MPEVYIGTIMMVGFNFAPQGWAFCNGQLLAISQNQALFSLLGVTYGGNGQTNFALPNLQSRVPIHMGQGQGLSPYTIGQVGGNENVSLQVGQMPAHTHTVATPCSNVAGTSNTPVNNYPAVDAATSSVRGETVTVQTYAPASVTGQTMAPVISSAIGGNQPHPNIQPYLTVNFIIALTGIFPPRS